jgi:hypothetical protein
MLVHACSFHPLGLGPWSQLVKATDNGYGSARWLAASLHDLHSQLPLCREQFF